MTPSWILNFSKEAPFGTFFEKYWDALLCSIGKQEHPEAICDADKWFHCTDCVTAVTDEHDLLQTARQLTSDLDQEHRKLIPCIKQNTRDLNVFFLGDITDTSTTSRLHLWAAKLRKVQHETPWTQLPSVQFFAILWRPNTAAFEPGIADHAHRFLNGLASLETLDINHRPFHKVLFMESSVVQEDKKAMFQMMEMVALQIASGNKSVTKPLMDDDAVYYNAGAAATFFESKVQREQESYLLSSLLLDRFCNSTSEAFFDAKEAEEYVDKKHASTLGNLKEEHIANAMMANAPIIPTEINSTENFSTVSAWGLNLRKVWKEFFLTELGGFKMRLITNISWHLGLYEKSYREMVIANQTKFVNAEKEVLEKAIFSIYERDARLRHIGLKQGMKIVERFSKRIGQLSREVGDRLIIPFSLPQKLEKALEEAQHDHPKETTREVLAVLEARLRTLPAINLSLAVRALVLGFSCGYLGHVFSDGNGVWTTIITTLSALLPVVWSLISFLSHARRINSLKDQYVACRLADMQQHLRDFILSRMADTYSELLFFLKWIQTNKLDFLSQQLSIIVPSAFTFEANKKLQPLLNYTLSSPSAEDINGLPFVPYQPVKLPTDEQLQRHLSGSFGRYPLLAGFPKDEVNIDNDQRTLMQLMDSHGEADCQRLCQQLMDEVVTISSEITKTIVFGNNVVNATKLLLLDVSGSMSGSPIEELKDAVSILEGSAHVEWIAFDDKVVATSYGGTDVNDLQAGGGTCYLPAIQEAVAYIQSNYVDQVILISDGSPFEGLEEILAAASGLHLPLNTITIGSVAENVMKEIAHRTGGEQKTVASAAEIQRNVKQIVEQLQPVEGGPRTFAQLLRQCHIPGCARALYNFTDERLTGINDNMVALLTKFSEIHGLEEWAEAAQPSCTLSQAANTGDVQIHLIVVDGTRNDCLKDFCTQHHLEAKVSEPAGVPDIMATLFTFQTLSIGQFNWACYSKEDDTIDRDAITSLMQKGYQLVNIYGKEI